MSIQDGLTALDFASANEQPEIFQILALNGAVHGTPTQPEVCNLHLCHSDVSLTLSHPMTPYGVIMVVVTP